MKFRNIPIKYQAIRRNNLPLGLPKVQYPKNLKFFKIWDYFKLCNTTMCRCYQFCNQSRCFLAARFLWLTVYQNFSEDQSATISPLHLKGLQLTTLELWMWKFSTKFQGSGKRSQNLVLWKRYKNFERIIVNRESKEIVIFGAQNSSEGKWRVRKRIPQFEKTLQMVNPRLICLIGWIIFFGKIKHNLSTTFLDKD